MAKLDLSFYAALSRDIIAWDSELEPFLLLDLERLERIVSTRGISFIMIEMPDACKAVDAGLAFGRLWTSSLPESFGGERGGYRKFLRCLFAKVFDDGGRLRGDVEAKAVFFLRQFLLLAKKIEENCSDAAIQAEVTTFRQIDESLFPPSLNWLGDDLQIGDRRLAFDDNLRLEPDLFDHKDSLCPRFLTVAQLTADIVSSMMPALDWRSVIPRHGPGAVADAKTGTDKFRFPTWSAKLERVFPQAYFTQTREDLSAAEVNVLGRPTEPPVRLMAVPKTLKAPRMIASEPVAHQFIQLGLMRWFRENLPYPIRLCVDFKDQTPSRVACLNASQVGDIATVDLSAASDRLSCWVIERFFRSNPSILEALHACRSRWLVNSSGQGEAYHLILRKYAPMGNGTTFPVQSIVYAALSIAAVLWERQVRPTQASIIAASRCIRVFGDDIILPSSSVLSLTQLLSYLQLKVNRKKTFSVGKFRESCGIDAYAGHDVTPVYLSAFELKLTPEGLTSWVDVSKNAHCKGLHALGDWLEERIPQRTRELLPRTQGALGCLSLWHWCAGIEPTSKVRFNRRLQRLEMLALTSQACNITRKRESYGDLLQYFLEAPAPDSDWEAGYLVRKRSKLKLRWVPLY
jgi:hypothetical protein